MDYLEKLKQHVADLFGASQDNETIKKYAVVEEELKELQKILDQKDAKELELLKDLKEAYIHSSVTAEPGKNPINEDIGAGTVDEEALFDKIFLNK